MKYFLESDILIWHLRGRSEAKALLRSLIDGSGIELWIGAMQRAEVVFFMRENEVKNTMALLSLFKTHPVDQAIVDQAGIYYRQFNPSHGIDPNDALLAATVLLYGGRIISQNISHYPMPDIRIEKGW